jgi:probable F420-dependent oxidoreductase
MPIKIGVFQILPDRRGDPALVAEAAEELGFHSYWVPEHGILPVSFSSSYVGDPDSEQPPPPDYLWQMPDPWIALTRAATTTQRIRLGSGICLVPEHNPLLLAKQVASLDHYCGGRVEFGIGAGWNREEAEIMGVDFAHRWTQTHEAVEVMRALWMQDAAEHHGTYYDFPPVRSYPKPIQLPHPPIMIGSSGSPRVFQRVVAWGDGWIPVLKDLDGFARGCAELEARCRAAGRARGDLRVAPFALNGQFRSAAERDAVAAAGADELIVWLTARDVDDLVLELRDLAAELLAAPAA